MYNTGAISNHKDKSTKSAADAFNKAKSHFTNTGNITKYINKTTSTTDKAEYDKWLVFKNGGIVDYTGPAWVDGSKHSPEYVLNAKQTGQLFDMLTSDTINQILSTLNTATYAMLASMGLSAHAGSVNSMSHDMNQNVEIHAEFPAAQDRNEIEAAFDDLVNRATQYANRKW